MSTLEVSKFDDKGDCRLWQLKIQSVLIDLDLASTTTEVMKNLDKEALAVLHLILADNVLRQVCEEKTAIALWK